MNDVYRRQGLKTVLVEGKRPVEANWQSAETASPEIIPPGYNVGVVLGHLSNSLVDVDIDDDAALPFADRFLPTTGKEFGRGSRRRTHRLFTVADAERITTFSGSGGMIIELRGNGHQTVFPGSTHPDGDEITFDCDGEPATASWSELRSACQKVAVATACRPHWVAGSRHHFALALAGVLRNAGWSQEASTTMVQAIAEEARDNDVQDRLKAVHDTFGAEPSSVAGFSALTELIGEIQAQVICKLAGFALYRTPGTAANNNNRFSYDTDVHCAEAFAARHKGTLIYGVENKCWYLKKDGIFDPISDAEVQGKAMQFAKDVESSGVGMAQLQEVKKLQSAAKIKSTIELSRSALIVNRDRMDKAEDMIGTLDGVLSLNGGKIDRYYDGIVTKRINVQFDPDADCPKFLAFLNETFEEDQEVIEFLQRVMGYTLSGETGEHACFLFIGSGANGKSTFLELFGRLFGDYGGVTPAHSLMVQKYGNDKTDDLANLVGLRFVRASESEAGAKMAVAKIKMMTGGDTIACRLLYRNQFIYKPQFKLFLATNDLPNIDDNSDSTWRRIHVVRFPNQVPPEKRNGNLVAELMEEAPGILNWCLEGYQAWKATKLNPPMCIKDETESYRNDNDTVQQFISENCTIDGVAVSPAGKLYEAYELWCNQNAKAPLSVNRFAKELPRFSVERKRMNTGNCWVGIRITPLIM